MNATLTTLTEAAKTALPGQDARIDRAAAIVTAQDVWPMTDGTSFLVGSQSDAVLAHLVRRPNGRRNGHGGHGWTCDCKDFQYRGGLCQHIAASMLTVRLGNAYTAKY